MADTVELAAEVTPARVLELEIGRQTKEIVSENYPMSIGELVSLYRGDDAETEPSLVIKPEFQRLFIWKNDQKSRFIESILLGLPIPSIFVITDEDGRWEVIDGLQRLSTIFELIGILRGPDGNTLDPLKLERTEYLPSLEGMLWKNPLDPTHELSVPVKRDILRSKLHINILRKQSSQYRKYDIFDRLNSGGTQASSQEVRNAMILQKNEALYNAINSCATLSSFTETTNLPESNLDRQYDKELVVRFFTLQLVDLNELSKKNGNDFFSQKIIEIGLNSDQINRSAKDFARTFDTLLKELGSNCFGQLVGPPETNVIKFKGGFKVSSFEIIALGLGYHIASNPEINIAGLKEKLFMAQSSKDFPTWAGRNTTDRILKTVKFGREFFDTFL